MPTIHAPRNPLAPTSPAQGSFMRRLAASLGETVAVPATMGEASLVIDALKSRISAAPKVAAAELEIGIYEHGTEIYKVQRARGYGGQLYAKMLVITGTNENAKGHFDYAPGVIRLLSPANRLTLDQAKALGHRYGICIVCSANLSDEKSVERGMGSTCAKRF